MSRRDKKGGRFSKRGNMKDSWRDSTRPPNSSNPAFPASSASSSSYKSDRQKAKEREERDRVDAELDSRFGFEPYLSPDPCTAFLFNMRASTLADSSSASSSFPSSSSSPSSSSLSCVDCFFVCDDGRRLKASLQHYPYFYILLRSSSPSDYLEAEQYLLRRFEAQLLHTSQHDMEDLGLPNHLSGLRRSFVRLSFRNVQDLTAVRNQLMPDIRNNRRKASASTAFASPQAEESAGHGDSHALRSRRRRDVILDSFVDIREYDVPYVTRVAIDLGVRVGCWYDVRLIPASASSASAASPSASLLSHALEPRPELLTPPLLKKLTFDIETTKSPLKFPSAEHDHVMLLSLMVDDRGVLLVNRDIVGADVDDFDYSPSADMRGEFRCINVAGEKELLLEFFRLVREEKPVLFITYNGDFFDWPFIDRRCAEHGLSLLDEIGIYARDDEYCGKNSVHLDAFQWVKRDSYLPQGSQGLKAVTKAKLKYDPVEVDPEQMLTMAADDPQQLAAYSVSDAVATYYLYMKYVHLFVFSLATIIPMAPSDVLRKGSGTLCESLLQVQAKAGNIISPNKQEDELDRFYNGHLIDSETYIGGHVECIESGVFRADIPVRFKLSTARLQRLRDGLTTTLRFAVEKEHGRDWAALVNGAEVMERVGARLDALLACPVVDSLPLIYHLDVGAMYPNIILTNRLQPMAIVDETVCAACDFNVAGSDCQRAMEWRWKGKFFPVSRAEVEKVRKQLEYESEDAQRSAALSAEPSPSFPSASFSSSSSSSRWQKKKPATAAAGKKTYASLDAAEQSVLLKARVKELSHTYHKAYTEERTETRTAVVCQRENSFYVDTVRAFRDRRYEYKVAGKRAKRDVDAATSAGDVVEREKANDRLLVYDSLQLAHKCILNSFYGYVMRRGARWQSIEMAGVVTHTGAELIKEARELVDDIGRPLELDTDGIWCMLPVDFPDTFDLHWADGSKATWSYPCSLLNEAVAARYSNPQYQQLTHSTTADGRRSASYERRTECSILFEVDGPYRAMILPAAREEGKNIKKRYAVFADDGSISELKGFEIKRRGELKLIKVFQGQVFERFLHGRTLDECYRAVGDVCDVWLDWLLSHGGGQEESDILELISESKSMSDTLDEYGARKSTAISTAKRLGEFLGQEMLADRGLNCTFVIAAKPHGASTSERAIPTAIFAVDDAVKKKYLRAWLKDATLDDFSIRELIDWPYYVQRLSAAIQKIVTIPAAMQKVPNPVERVKHPDWLGRRVKERDEAHQQRRIDGYFTGGGGGGGTGGGGEASGGAVMDIEDVGGGRGADGGGGGLGGRYTVVKRKKAAGVRISLQGEDSSAEAAVLADPSDDVEDITAEKRPRPASPPNPPGDADHPMPPTDAADEEMPAASDAAPAETDGFGSWLATRKAEWKTLRDRRKRQRHAPSTAASSTFPSLFPAQAKGPAMPSLTDGLRSYLQHSTTSLLTSAWQVVQITEDVQPGHFRFWVFLHPSTLTSVTVRADRTVLLNSRVRLADDEHHRRVERTLPRGRKAHFLYEMRVPESEWREKESEYLDALRDASVEGMYETQVPLLLKLIRDVGCVCRVTPAPGGRPGGGAVFDVDELVYKTTVETAYLDSPSLYKAFLYESHHASKAGLGLLALFLEGERDALLVVVNAYGGEVEAVKAAALYKDEFNAVRRAFRQRERSAHPTASTASPPEDDGPDEQPDPRHTFLVRHVSSTADAFALVHDHLSRYKQTAAHPTVLLTQLSCPLSVVLSHIPSLRSDFPVLSIPHHTADCGYPAFRWLSFAVRHALTRYLTCGEWWTSQLELCRYAHVPIGNLQVDVPSQLLDLVYARSLRDGKQVLWTSRGGGGEIEVGGRWIEEERAMVGEGDDGRRLEVNHSGCYRSTCYELTLQRLCVNAVLQSALIEEEHGATNAVDALLEASASSVASPAAASSVARPFAILKQLAVSLYQDAITRSSLHADLLLQHFHRWLYSVSSSLSDSLLHAHVASLMTKLYHSLLSRLAVLGSTIVHASFQRVVLCTKKRDAGQAETYIAFIRDTLTKRPLYTLLGFAITGRYAALLYYDAYNDSRVAVIDEADDALFLLDPDRDSDAYREPSVQSAWHMASFLPLRCRRWLLFLIKRFLLQPHRHALQHKHGLPTTDGDECCHAVLVDVLRAIERQLYAILTDIARPSSDPQADLDFPTLPGAHLSMTNAGLELVKQITHALSLDASVVDEVRVLRENLFRVLGVNAWSAEGTFVNTCRPLLLRDVVCDFCNIMKDVDLCRNAGGAQGREAVAGDGEDGEEEGVQALQCEGCTFAYDRRVIEERVMRSVRQRVLRYQLQDLVCRACGSMQDRYLQRRCDCSGEYRGQREDGGRDDRLKEWRVMERVCKQYGYAEAHEMIATLRRMDGGAEDDDRAQQPPTDPLDLSATQRDDDDDDDDM